MGEVSKAHERTAHILGGGYHVGDRVWVKARSGRWRQGMVTGMFDEENYEVRDEKAWGITAVFHWTDIKRHRGEKTPPGVPTDRPTYVTNSDGKQLLTNPRYVCKCGHSARKHSLHGKFCLHDTCPCMELS